MEMMFITSECERMGSMNYKNIFDALNMTFRPAARCGLDVGGNLRRLIGSAWAGGISIPIAGRFLRRFRSRFEGRRFRGTSGEYPGALPGGRREREMFRVGVPPTARRRAATTGLAWSGRLAYRALGERCLAT